MDPIEQAILYIKDHRRAGTGTIVAKTPDVRQIDEEELIGWAFDFEGDLPDSGCESHLYFHPLPSGCYVLGQQSLVHDTDGNSVSLLSHCLIVTPRLLRAFHNNILAIHQALLTRGDFHFLTAGQCVDTSSLVLSPVKMGVRHVPVIDKDLLEAVRDYPGAAGFANLLSLSIHSVCTIFTWLSPSIPLINGIIQCLPIALRPELSFASSLHFSATRPLRLIAAHENYQNVRDICSRYAVPFFHIVHFDANMLLERLLSHQDWATLVYHILEQGLYHDFAGFMAGKLKSCSFETQRNTPDWNLLNRVGKAMLHEWNRNEGGMTDSCLLEGILPSGNEPDKVFATEGNRLMRGDYSHTRFQPESNASPGQSPDMEPRLDSVVKDSDLEEIIRKQNRVSVDDSPETATSRPTSRNRLTRKFPKYEREIRQLDSLLARSLFGDSTALESLETLWRELHKHLTFDEIEIIRETYLRLVQSIIVQPRDPNYPKPPRRTIDSLDVMNIFLQE